MKIHRSTVYLSLVSLLNSLSMGIVISGALGLSKSLQVNITFLFYMKTIGQICGYFGKITVGIVSDYIKNRKTFLLFGYGLVILLKPMFIISSMDAFSLTQRYILFALGNSMDQFLNYWRDVPRDAIIADHVPQENLKSNIFFRKCLSLLGTVSGGLITFFASKYVTYTVLYTCAAIPSIIGFVILIFWVHDNHSLKTTKEIYKLSTNIFNSKFIILLLAIILLFTGKLSELLVWNRAVEYGVMTREATQLLYVMYYVVCLLSSVCVTIFTISSPVILGLTLALSVVVMQPLLLRHFNIYTVLATNFIYAINHCLMEGLMITEALNLFPCIRWKATIIGIVNFIMGIGCMLPAWITIFTPNNKDVIFTFSTITTLIGIVFLFWHYIGNYKSNNK